MVVLVVLLGVFAVAWGLLAIAQRLTVAFLIAVLPSKYLCGFEFR